MVRASRVAAVFAMALGCSEPLSVPADASRDDLAAIDREPPPIPSIPCASAGECPPGSPVCEPTRGRCQECVTTRHCGNAFTCVRGRCVPRTACSEDAQCATGACARDLGVCVECTDDRPCGGVACAGYVCVGAVPCASSATCEPYGLVCPPGGGSCRGCNDSGSCEPGQSCGAGFVCVRGDAGA